MIYSKQNKLRSRHGAAMALVAIALAVLMVVGALAINWSSVQLSRANARAASDAVARASLSTLGRLQKEDEARAAGLKLATSYEVGGQALTSENVQIEFGHTTSNETGFEFVAGQKPFNSCRTTIDCPRVDVLLSGFLSIDSYRINQQSHVDSSDLDICLVIDRSGSMAWDMLQGDFGYPPPVSDFPDAQAYLTPPHPEQSRWKALQNGVEIFTANILDTNQQKPLVGVVSFADDFELGDFESKASTREVGLVTSSTQINNALIEIGSEPLIGGTNISKGLEEGIDLLVTGSNTRITASKIMVLFTDGIHTSESDPVRIAESFVDEHDGRIFGITYSDQANQTLVNEIATATGGLHIHSSTPEELEEAFRKISIEVGTRLLHHE